ncbi:hypothetical protein JXB28_03555 [Candidatus Woesearchaeota archaeon]|nr:hypothetical protein [Candidatus Woesearchaeota archaeon]
MKKKTLGDIVDEAIAEYSPPKGRWEKIKNSLITFASSHKSEIILGSTVLLGATGYLYGSYVGESMQNVMIGLKDIDPQAFANEFANKNGFWWNHFSEGSRALFSFTGASIGYITSKFAIPNHVGKGVYSKIKPHEEEGKKKKIGKIFRYPKTMGLITALITNHNYKMIIETPQRISMKMQVYEKVFPGNLKDSFNVLAINQEISNAGFFLIFFGLSSMTYYLMREIEHNGKRGFKEISEYFRSLPLEMVGLFSKEKKIELMKKACEKRGSHYLKHKLSRDILKKDLNEGLIYCKEWLDSVNSGEKRMEYVRLKKLGIGNELIQLNEMKEDWSTLLDFTLDIYKENPEAAKRIVERVRKEMPDERVDVHYLLNTFSEEILKEPQEENWINLARNLQKLSGKGELIESFESSEGRTWVYTGSKIINLSLVSKERSLDYLTRLIQQRFEYETLIKTGIKSEKPLGFFEENQKLYALTTRVGKSTLREALKGKDKKERKEAFERVIEDGMKAQKILHERVRKEKGDFIMDVRFGDRDYSTKLELIDLEQQLLHRAFIGDNKRKNRFGVNEHLEPLLKEIAGYVKENYSPVLLTVNHGDFFTTNITDAYARIDARHIVADTLYDTTHISLDPVFVALSKEQRMEINFVKLNDIYELKPADLEPKFINAYDVQYLCNSLCLSASIKAQGNKDEAAQILEETIRISKGKPFEKELTAYLRNSSAKDLMRII